MYMYTYMYMYMYINSNVIQKLPSKLISTMLYERKLLGRRFIIDENINNPKPIVVQFAVLKTTLQVPTPIGLAILKP